MKLIKKRSLTLIEIMVVIALIGIIGSVLGVNMKKSMDKAKKFKSSAHARKIEDALNMHYAENSESVDEILAKTPKILSDSGLFKDDKNLLVDAFNKPLKIVFEDGGFVCSIEEPATQ